MADEPELIAGAGAVDFQKQNRLVALATNPASVSFYLAPMSVKLSHCMDSS